MSAVDEAKKAGKYTSWVDAAKNADDANIIKTFSMISTGAKEAAADVDASSGIIVKGLTAIKGGATGLWSSLSAFGKIGLVIAAVMALKKVWDYLDDTFVLTNQAAEKKMNESFDAFTSAKSDVESVNTELSETKDRIDELSAKGPLTITEKDELNNLKEQNKLLQIELDLKRKIADEKAVEAGDSAADNFTRNYGEGTSEQQVKDLANQYEEYYGKGSFSNLRYSDLTGFNIYANGDNLTQVLFRLRGYQNMLDNEKKSENPDVETIKTLSEGIESTKASLNDEASNLIDIIDKMTSIPEAKRTISQTTALKQAQTSLDEIYRFTNPTEWKQMRLDDFLSERDISAEKDDLLYLAKKHKYDGGIKASDLSSRFQAAADKAGLAKVLGDDYIQAIVDQINAEAGVFDSDSAKSSLKSGFAKSVGSFKWNNPLGQRSTKLYNDWIDELSPEDTELVYKLSLNADSANWTLEQWQQKLADLKSGADVAVADFQTQVTSV